MGFHPLLSLASGFYWAGLAFDKAIKSKNAIRLPRPTLSVGNLTVGGTGKTPLLIRLAKDLSNNKKKPAILTRGYRGFMHLGSKPRVLVGTPEENKKRIGDESLLMADRLPNIPIGVGPNRAKNSQKILAESQVDLFLLDDGFQHWRLRRDYDIVCVDTTDPWGGGHLVPWGRLREFPSALKRANVVVLTRSELSSKENLDQLKAEIKSIAPNVKVFTSFFTTHLIDAFSKRKVTLSSLKGQKLIALSGIGNPSSFELLIMKAGVKILPIRFPDHHVYRKKDLERIEKNLEDNAGGLVTTEKDWTKLKFTKWADRDRQTFPIYMMKIDLDFVAEDKNRWIDSLKPFLL